MSSIEDPAGVSDAVELFIQGAKTLHLGYFLETTRLQNKGFDTITRAVETIDRQSPTGREVLVPLLDHDDEGVRTVAAAGVWQSHFDRAVDVLADVKDYGETEATRLAIVLLMTRGQVNLCGSDPRFPSLYGPEGEKPGGGWEAMLSDLPPLGMRRRQKQ